MERNKQPKKRNEIEPLILPLQEIFIYPEELKTFDNKPRIKRR